jgi:hypothetical protein
MVGEIGIEVSVEVEVQRKRFQRIEMRLDMRGKFAVAYQPR